MIIGNAISPFRKTSGGALPTDEDAEAFISANGITSQSEINALNAVMIALKGGNSLSKDFYSDVSYVNFISPTSLAVAKKAMKYPTTQTATAIGAEATHSADGVLFNGSSNAWDLNNSFSAITQANFLVLLSRTNTITVAGVSFGANDVTASNRGYFYPRPTVSGFLTGASHGVLNLAGIYVGSNDGTNLTIHKDGVKITPSAETARLTGSITTKDAYLGARNNNATTTDWVDEKIACVLVSNMNGTPYTTNEIAVLSQIIQTYNTNV